MENCGRFLALIGLLLAGMFGSGVAAAESDHVPVTVCTLDGASAANATGAFAQIADFDCSRNAFNLATEHLWILVKLPAQTEGNAPSHLVFTGSRQGDITLYVPDADGGIAQRVFSPLDQARHWHVFDTQALPLPAAPHGHVLLGVERPWDPTNWGNFRWADHSSLDHQHTEALIWTGFFCGILVAPLLLNLVFSFVLQARFVLFHSIMMGSVLIYALSWSGVLFLILPGLDMVHRSVLNHVVIPIAFAAATLLTYALCEEGVLGRLWQWFLMVIGLLPLLTSTVLMIMAPQFALYGSQVLHGVILLPVIAILAALIFARRKGSRMALIQLVGWSALGMWICIRVFVGLGIMPLIELAEKGFFPALVFEVMVTTAAVAYRLVQLRKERDNALSRHAELSRIAETDFLTSIPNRRGFMAQFEALFARVHRRRGALALLLLDIDHFKRVNDRHGHETGDDVLVELAKLLSSETRHDDMCARLGGEEFALTVHAPTEANILDAAERLRARIAEHPFKSRFGVPLTLTVSIGLVHLDLASPEGFPAYYERADQALYSAKRLGRNQVCVAAPTRPSVDPTVDLMSWPRRGMA